MQTSAAPSAPRAGVLRRLSIPRKLLLVSAVYVVIIAGLLALAHLALGFLSDVRAYVGGEGLWSKSQKDAMYHLATYVTLHREEDFARYTDAIRVPLGDRKARLALSAATPDLERAAEGFLEGRNHADDVRRMTTFFRRFGRVPQLARAIAIWGEADVVLDDLRALAARVHAEVQGGDLTREREEELLRALAAVNDRLTVLEDDFSFTLGEGARDVRRWAALAMLLLTAVALGAGGALSWRISSQIGGGVLTLRDGARRVAGGDLSRTLAVDSQDEIGELARAFNVMTASLVRHISALEEARAALAEMDRLKTQFFANVSHELRTPLTLILGPAERLAASPALPESLRREVVVIERNAHVLHKHVDDLLDLSRLDAGHMAVEYATVDLARLVRRVASHFEVLAEERRLALALEAPAAAPVEVDPAKLERVLFNLLSNAFKFTPRGGSIALRLAAGDGEVELRVEDSGPGVPPELRAAIFERFRQGEGGATREHGGTGLGLAIVREFVELHHGTVRVEAAPAGGAAFVVALPRRAPAETAVAPSAPDAAATDLGDARRARPILEELREPAPAAPRPTAPGAWHAPLVLVVEDNAEMNRFLVETLAPHYRTASARDGAEGLERARAARPDLVVSDVMMPRLSGDQLLAALRADPALRETPFLVLTAKADDALRVRMLRSGAQDFLVKPFSAAELVTRAENLIAVRQARAALEDELHGRPSHEVALAQEASRRRRELQSGLERLHKSEVDLRLALHEKEVLLHEVHHRVKNNLQIVVSLLSLQRQQIAPGPAAAALAQCQDRVRAMAVLHERMVQSTDLGRVDLGGYLRALVTTVHGSQALDHGAVALEIDVPDLVVDADLAIPCGLIVHELVSNALLHAFPAGRRGTIWVRGSHPRPGALVLEVRDDGAGLPPEIDPDRPASLGLQLVSSLAAQLGGRVTLERRRGTAFTLEIAA